MMRTDKYKVFRIPADKILPNPAQPRQCFDEDKLKELAESIRENGLLQPITVRKNDSGQYEIIAGERRYRAAKMVGYRTLPCIISECTVQQSAALAIIENIQRCDLDCFEEACAIKELMNISDLTQEGLAQCLGKSQPAIANKLRLLNLREEERQLIRKNNLTERHARELLRLSLPEERNLAIKEIAERHLNVSQTEKWIDLYLEKNQQKKRASTRRFILKDIRIFLNTIEHAVETVRFSGLNTQMEKVETDEYIQCTVKISKSR